MPITTNRNPLSVTTKSGAFKDPHYFNQVSWNGLNDNRNIATIDPQSFNSCNNVFMDLNEVLCSRPAIKKDGLFDDDVVRFWETSDGRILEYTTDGMIRLKPVGNEELQQILVGKEVSLIQIEGRAFIFNNNNCWVYEEGKFVLVDRENIQDYIYLPEVEIYTDGNPESFESRNLATDYVTYTHIKGVNSYLDEAELNGEKVFYTDENGQEANVTWVANVTNRILLDFYTRRKFDYLSIATNGAGAIAVDNNSLFYSVDGTTWKQLTMPEGRLAEPIITKDGTTCLIVLPSGLYAITLVGAGFEGEIEYPNWTNICKPFLRQWEGDPKVQEKAFMDGTIRTWNQVLGLEAISYDNYILVASGPLKNDNSNFEKTVTIYGTHSSFSRIAKVEGNEILYKAMSTDLSGTGDNSTISIPYSSRADNSNTYTRVPICRTLTNIDTTDSVKIILKDIMYQNSQMVSLLFKSKNLNDTIALGVPSLPNNKNYYALSKQNPSASGDNAYILNNTPGTPAVTTQQSNSDKIRYAVMFLEPGVVTTTGESKVEQHTFRALGDPWGVGGRYDNTNETTINNTKKYKNLFQREIRTYGLSFVAADLDPSLSELEIYGKVGTTLLTKNIGFEFMENALDTASMNYQIRFFFPLSANQSNGGSISLGLIDKTVNIRYGVLGEPFPAGTRPNKPNGEPFNYGEKLLSSSTTDFSKMQFRIRPQGDRKLGIRAYLKTEGKDKHSSEFTGTSEFLDPNSLKLSLEGDYKISGYAPSESQNDNACILELGGDRIVANSISFGETNLISLLKNAVERRMSENPDYKTINNLAASSLMYKEMLPSDYEGNIYQTADGKKFYKLKFKKMEDHYTVTPKSFDNPDKVIQVPDKAIAINDYDGKPVTDLGNYYIDCWFYWDGYQVSFEECSYVQDGGWNLDDKSTPMWYGPSSTFGDNGSGKTYSNQYKSTLMEIPYVISSRDYDTAVLSPEFIAVTNPTPGIGATFYPTVTKFKDILYFGSLTLTKTEEGFHMTNQYNLNKALKYHYKQGREFNLQVLDGWVENNRRIYGYINNVIYIEDRRYTKDRKPLLYVPENSLEKRDKQITGLINFSKGVVGIFHENEIWYMYPSYDDENKLIGYVYSKGKVGLGLTYGGDVETLYDGKTICFATYTGVVGLQYEALTQNEEQVLTYLSDKIGCRFNSFYERSFRGVKIFQYKCWIYFWEVGFKDCLVYDVRNGSWWPFSFATPILNFAKYKDKLYIHTEEGWATPTEESWYLDYDNDVIDWHFQSQELSLGNINYKKRIVNITLQSLETDERKFSAILTCKNFRKTAFVSKEEVLEYKIDVVRTYVHRLNYLQSVQFQYLLSNDKQRAKKEQTPLSLSAAIVKYEIGEAVR